MRNSVPLAIGAVAIGGLALYNAYAARRAERANPARGRFLTVDGVRLHWREGGSGPTVVFVHGNGQSADDLWVSGLGHRLAPDFRLIAIDRPGFGHSARPPGRVWNAAAQARLLLSALSNLRISNPILVGHSWGTLVALEMALAAPQDVAGVVLVSGYYHPTARKDVLMAGLNALPVVGDLLRNTVVPLVSRLMLPLVKRKMFAPSRPPKRFLAAYSDDMAVRPLQLRASGADAATMIPDAAHLTGRVQRLHMPVAILASGADRIVEQSQATQLHAALPSSRLTVVPGMGHMLHHLAPDTVAEAVREVSSRAA